MNGTITDEASRTITAPEASKNALRTDGTEDLSESDDDLLLKSSRVDSMQRKPATSFDDSDSDDDDLEPSLSGFENLNLPAKMKRLMQGVNLDKVADSSDDDDDDILADNALFRTPAAVKTAEVQSMLKQPPPSPTPTTTEKNKKTRQKSKKQPPKRPKPKEPIDYLAQPSSSSSSDSEEDDNMPKRRGASKKRTLAETLNFLAQSSDDGQGESDEESATRDRQRPPKRAMSKRAELLMHQETQRLARSTSASLNARQGKLGFEGFLERLKLGKNNTSFSTSIESPDEPKRPTSPVMMAYDVEQKDEDEDDLEVVGGPSIHLLPSPEQNRFHWQSPPRKPQVNLNRQLQQRIAKEIIERRKEAEEKARTRGEYKSAQESAEKQLQREREAQLIGLQVQQHLLKNAARSHSDEESVPDESHSDEESVPDEEEEEEEEEFETLEYPASDNDDDEEQGMNDSDTPIPETEDLDKSSTKKRRRIIFSDEEEEDVEEEEEGRGQEDDKEHSADNQSEPEEEEEQAESKAKEQTLLATSNKTSASQTKTNSEYVDAEAEESEDEFYGAGGPDDPDGEDLDVYEQDGMLVDKTDEHVDEAALRAALNSQLAESDKHMVDRILKDIISGGLRRQRAAKEAGFILDDFNIFDVQDDDLVALRRAAAERRRRIQEDTGDALAALAKNPKTAAFAKAALPVPDESDRLELDQEEKQTDNENEDDDDDDEDDNKMDVDSDNDGSEIGYSPNANIDRTGSRPAWMDWLKPRRKQVDSAE